MGLVSKLQSWAAKPFNEDGDVISASLTVILVVTVAWGWSRVLKHLA